MWSYLLLETLKISKIEFNNDEGSSGIIWARLNYQKTKKKLQLASVTDPQDYKRVRKNIHRTTLE